MKMTQKIAMLFLALLSVGLLFVANNQNKEIEAGQAEIAKLEAARDAAQATGSEADGVIAALKSQMLAESDAAKAAMVEVAAEKAELETNIAALNARVAEAEDAVAASAGEDMAAALATAKGEATTLAAELSAAEARMAVVQAELAAAQAIIEELKAAAPPSN